MSNRARPASPGGRAALTSGQRGQIADLADQVALASMWTLKAAKRELSKMVAAGEDPMAAVALLLLASEKVERRRARTEAENLALLSDELKDARRRLLGGKG